MAGIIINNPPIIPPQLINPTSTIMPVNYIGTFIDSNIKNLVDDIIETEVGGFPMGVNLDFTNQNFGIGNPATTTLNVNGGLGQIEIDGVLTTTPVVVADKLMYVKINGLDYYIQLYVTP